VAPLQPDDAIPARELSSWERHLFAGVRMVGSDEPPASTELEPNTSLVTIRPVVIQYYGSIIQTGLLDAPISPLPEEAP